jgi:hypothetical protein
LAALLEDEVLEVEVLEVEVLAAGVLLGVLDAPPSLFAAAGALSVFAAAPSEVEGDEPFSLLAAPRLSFL